MSFSRASLRPDALSNSNSLTHIRMYSVESYASVSQILHVAWSFQTELTFFLQTVKVCHHARVKEIFLLVGEDSLYLSLKKRHSAADESGFSLLLNVKI